MAMAWQFVSFAVIHHSLPKATQISNSDRCMIKGTAEHDKRARPPGRTVVVCASTSQHTDQRSAVKLLAIFGVGGRYRWHWLPRSIESSRIFHSYFVLARVAAHFSCLL